MNKAKIISIILAVFMIFSIFAVGCGYKNNGESSSKEEKTTTTEKAEKTTTTAQTTTAVTTTEEKTVLPFLSESFVYSSFMASWEAELELKQDGSFTADFGAWVNYEDFENSPNGGRQEFHFKGNFTNITKIDDVTYSMELANIENTETLGEKDVDGVHIWVLDATDSNKASTVGFNVNDKFMLYFPGTEPLDMGYKVVNCWNFLLEDGASTSVEKVEYFTLYEIGEEGGAGEDSCFFGKTLYHNSSDKKNLMNTMTPEEVVKLNKFFDPFCNFNNFKDIKTPKDVFIFGVHKYQDGKGEYSISEKLVEENIKRYFDVETMNHNSVGNDENSRVMYKDGYYNSGAGEGDGPFEWYNVYNFKKNSDGTYTAKMRHYYWDGFMDWMFTIADKPPGNYYDRIDRWDMGDLRIVHNTDYADNFNNPKIIQILSDDTVVLSPYTVDGEESWRIVSINGFEIPKDLSCE
jgi:hypothetical protein